MQAEERQARRKLGSIIAAIGAELIAAKEALDKLSAKTAWLRWLKNHVHYSVATAENYMRVARFGKRTETFPFFSIWIPVFCIVSPRNGSVGLIA